MIEVTRPNTKEQVFRRYSEFHELHTKMVSQFPDHTLPALPGKIYVGRSQVRQVSLLNVLVLHTPIIKYTFEIHLSITCIAGGKKILKA